MVVGIPVRLAWAVLFPTLIAWEAWAWFLGRWSAESGFFGHGPFIAAASVLWAGFLARTRRVEIGGGTWPGFLAAAISALLLYVLAGRGVGFLGAVGWWLAVVGLVWTGLGWRGLRSLLGPLVLLLFMIPWPLKLVDDLSVPLKSAALELGLLLSPADAVREGHGAYILLADGGRLLVGEVCSGLSSLVTLLAMGYLVAAATRSGLFGKWVVFAMAAPIAVVSNALRIAVLITVADGSGVDAVADGTLAHDGTGVLVYGAALALLLLTSRVSGRARGGAPRSVGPNLAVPVFPQARRTVATSVLIAAGATAGWLGAMSAPSVDELPDLATALPRVLEPPPGVEGPSIAGRDVPLLPATQRLLQPEGFLSRVYGERGSYHLCVVYGRGRRTRLHAPEICFRGNGFEILHKRPHTPRVAVPGGGTSVQELRILRGRDERLTWYWYRSARHTTASYTRFVIGNLLDPGAPQSLVWLSIPLEPGKLRRARARLDWFLEALSDPLAGVFRDL